jgi:hypothetical protein
MEESFAIDLAGSREVHLAEWRRRPWVHRVFEWFWFQFRAMF